MTPILVLIIGVVLLALGYIFYGSWLAKQWGVNPARETPAHTRFDNNDYVPTHPAVLMGHHFSSIAGAGPINGPIQAAVFGWLPVFLWVVIGGIFFGAMHDFGALFASIRHGGLSVAEVVRINIGEAAYKLFIIFALLVLILVIASFTAVVSGTFAVAEAPALFTTGLGEVHANASTAMTSLLFIVLAIFFGYAVYRKGVKVGPATVVGVIGIVVITVIGLYWGINLGRTAWVIFIAVYITLASLLPVWILLQPRDYLSSFLLYAMLAMAAIGVIGSVGKVELQLPMFTGFQTKIGFLFPALFITVACGAISGFHSLVSSGTSSKQINNEGDAKVIGYGAMIIECILAILSLLAIAVVYNEVVVDGALTTSPPNIFAQGIATMVTLMTGQELGASILYKIVFTLLTLAVSVFALTSLDTGTRLGRYLFTELFLPMDKKIEDLTGAAKFFAQPAVGTIIMVVIGCGIGFLKLSQIWSLFGAANQLLAGIALMAVACWLGNIGKNNKMFFIPMIFMLAATLSSLLLTLKAKLAVFSGGTPAWGDYFQFIFALALVVLALILVVSGVKTFSRQAKGEVTGNKELIETTK